MGKPSKYEKETIVNFNEGEKEASIYTFNADLKRRLAEFSKKYPLLCRLEKSTPEVIIDYSNAWEPPKIRPDFNAWGPSIRYKI